MTHWQITIAGANDEGSGDVSEVMRHFVEELARENMIYHATIMDGRGRELLKSRAGGHVFGHYPAKAGRVVMESASGDILST